MVQKNEMKVVCCSARDGDKVISPEFDASSSGSRSGPQHLDFRFGDGRRLSDSIRADVAKTTKRIAKEAEATGRVWRGRYGRIGWAGCQQEADKFLKNVRRPPSL